jgi:hypothetical protein
MKTATVKEFFGNTTNGAESKKFREIEGELSALDILSLQGFSAGFRLIVAIESKLVEDENLHQIAESVAERAIRHAAETRDTVFHWRKTERPNLRGVFFNSDPPAHWDAMALGVMDAKRRWLRGELKDDELDKIVRSAHHLSHEAARLSIEYGDEKDEDIYAAGKDSHYGEEARARAYEQSSTYYAMAGRIALDVAESAAHRDAYKAVNGALFEFIQAAAVAAELESGDYDKVDKERWMAVREAAEEAEYARLLDIVRELLSGEER